MDGFDEFYFVLRDLCQGKSYIIKNSSATLKLKSGDHVRQNKKLNKTIGFYPLIYRFQ